MATDIKLSLKFNIAGNKVSSINYKYAKSSVTQTQAQTLAQAIITNGSIFKKVPLSIKDIKLITTNTNDMYDEA